MKKLVQEFNSYMEPRKLVTVHHVKSLKHISSFLLKFLRLLQSLDKVPSQKSTFGVKEWKEDFICALRRVQVRFSLICSKVPFGHFDFLDSLQSQCWIWFSPDKSANGRN